MATPSESHQDTTTDLVVQPRENFLISDSDSDSEAGDRVISFAPFRKWEVIQNLFGDGYFHVYHKKDGSSRTFTFLKELLPHVSREDLFLLYDRMRSHYSTHPGVLGGRNVYYDLSQLCHYFDNDRMSIF